MKKSREEKLYGDLHILGDTKDIIGEMVKKQNRDREIAQTILNTLNGNIVNHRDTVAKRIFSLNERDGRPFSDQVISQHYQKMMMDYESAFEHLDIPDDLIKKGNSMFNAFRWEKFRDAVLTEVNRLSI